MINPKKFGESFANYGKDFTDDRISNDVDNMYEIIASIPAVL